MSSWRRRLAAPTTAVLLGLAALTACSVAEGDGLTEESTAPDGVVPSPVTPGPATFGPAGPAGPASPGDGLSYVALGDSYAAAPGVPETDVAGGCFRSDSNYAHVLAEAADLTLVDVTCSGATSDDVIADQVPSLSPDTDLVTVGTGGNDLGLFIRVLTGCLTPPDGGSAAPDGSDISAGSRCAQVVREEIEPASAEIQAKMGAVLDAITAAAPDAEVYVVGYPALLPAQGTCPDVVPIAAADYPLVAGVTRALSESLREEAEARDLPFVDVLAASRGHDLCSDDPWVNGAELAADGTLPFHPLAVEQAAIATLIGDML